MTIRRQSYQGRDYWVIKDPIALKFYRFEEEEHALLQMLDGNRSPEQIKRAFDYEFAPQKITMQELYQFIGTLYRNCLLVSDAAGQGIELKHRGEQKTFQQFKGTLTNILAVRFKGFDPDGLLTFLNGWFRWIFSWPALALVMCLWLAAAGLLFTQFEHFTSRLPAFHEFFAAKNWIWLALVMAVTKIIHEFGHGLACKRFGGQCHEMGVMLLVLTPCLYCNVSDSWTLPSKWKRALIAAAGIYVELILAAIAVFVWWFSQPGIVNQLALNVIFVSSISTIAFNANPLLRYDGYYILSDLLEIPNLRQKATTILQRLLASWMLGIESRPDPFLPTRRKWFFALYSVAAVLYRWFITFSIFWFLYSVLEPYGVKIVGQAIALLAIWGLIGMPVLQAYRFFSVPGRSGTVNRSRAVFSGLALLMLLSAILLIPIPHYVRCPFIVQAGNAENIYVDVAGTLQHVYANFGDRVESGQLLLELENNDLKVQLEKLQAKIQASKSRYDTLVRASHSAQKNDRSADDLRLAAAEVASAEADLRQRLNDVERLRVKASQAGTLIPPVRIPPRKSDAGSLENWHGYPLERRNIGSYLEQSTLVGRVVTDENSLEAILTIDQSDIEFVQRQQAVELFPDSLPGTVISAETATISPIKMKSVPKSLSSRFGGDLITTQNEDGVDVPHSATFQVSVPFKYSDRSICDGCTGIAKVQVGSQTIGQRVWRLIRKTFRFDL